MELRFPHLNSLPFTTIDFYSYLYGVFFMDFAFKDTDKFRTNVILADEDTGKKFSNKMKQIFLALPKFEIENPTDCKTGFEI